MVFQVSLRVDFSTTSSAVFEFHDKGKPSVRMGRKAMGPQAPGDRQVAEWSGPAETRRVRLPLDSYLQARRAEKPRAFQRSVDMSYFLWTRKRFAMLSSISNAAVRFLKNEDGPTAVEYAVMLALIIVVCITAITALGTNANKTFTTTSNAIGSTSS
jgi:pilus assembly protein Flp/PilA